jgi:hypothetical protein
MTGFWDAYKFDILMQWLMAIAMEMAMVMVIEMGIVMMIVIISRKQKTPSILPCPDEAHAVIGNFT